MRIFVLLIVLSLALNALALMSAPSHASEAVFVDGDTIEQDGVTYRINGIDAPEFGQTCNKAGRGTWPCGKEALEELVSIVGRSDVRCEVHSEDTYGRTIATCYADRVDIGAELVRRGYAWAFVRYTDVYVDQEAAAKSENLGIWQAPTQPAWEYRDGKWSEAEQEAPEGCPIKGNISDNGRIYHTPWSPWYSRTKISEAKGERWFCNEAEARAAGWRAARWR